MTKIINQDTRQRVEVEWQVFPQDRTDNWELVRRVTTYPMTKGHAVQWQRGEVFTNDPVVIPRTEVAAVVQELVSWMGYNLNDKDRED